MAELTESLAVVFDRITGVVDDGRDTLFLAPTGCAGWSVQDLLFHLLLDAQRALVVLAQPVAAGADTDAVSYWRARAARGPGSDDRRHALFVRRSSTAYAEPAGLVAQWKDTSAAAVSAVRVATPDARVQTQGHVMTVTDFGWTLVVEGALHLLDLQLDAEWALPAEVTAVVRTTLEALLGEAAPPEWDDRTTALVLTGRRPVSAEARHLLDRVPVLR